MIRPASSPQGRVRKVILMIFEETDKRTGKKYIVGSKYWPDGTRFRRRFSNKTLAKSVLARIEGAIAMGTWMELRRELAARKSCPTKRSGNSRTWIWRSIAKSATRALILRRKD